MCIRNLRFYQRKLLFRLTKKYCTIIFRRHQVQTNQFNDILHKTERFSKMAIGVDTSKWKPRKIKGTPAAKVRNILGIGIITIGMFTGAFFHFSKITVGIRSAAEKLYEDPIEEVERRRMIAAGLPTVSGDTIRRMIEEEKRPDLPHK